MKKTIFWLILIVLIIGSAELICFIASKTFKERFAFFNSNDYLLKEKDLKLVYQKYHPERGWDNYYPTEFGERPRGATYNKPLISAFGDSYVHCDKVGHDETWEEYLSLLLHKDIYNLGTDGYGTDQAYLKFLSVFPKVKTPIVILGLIPENICRIVSVYRPFYHKNTYARLTKPRFVLKQGKLILLPNPVHSLDEIKNLQNPYFLNKIGRNDFWNYPEFKFPYLKMLFNKRIWLEIAYSLEGSKIYDVLPRPYMNLWKYAETKTLMYKILESFAAQAKNYGSIPIILLLPTEEDTISRFKSGKDSVAEKNISAFCRKNNILLFNLIGVLAENTSSISEIKSFFNQRHLSARGNQIIAEYLFKLLKEKIFLLNLVGI